ncbi:hypothetical protein HHK36_017976 [Tetracentron sinense]|uniref:Mediator of RNA polymerase II transcription subunit 25 n=1 Tax=Tetracentron sinense TaxID=13715 RepID=A0A834YV61_TETSI|nr:hypothetical protein HHK36_017976 [Tetracentron sinense]
MNSNGTTKIASMKWRLCFACEDFDNFPLIDHCSGKFLRRFRLPENAKVDQVMATMDNGFLTVTVPKEEVKKPEVKAIEISVFNNPFWCYMMASFLIALLPSWFKSIVVTIVVLLIVLTATPTTTVVLHNVSIWLSAIPFTGGGFSEAAIGEGLAEALIMFSMAPNGRQTQQNVDGQRHCILVAASNPYPLPTPVFRPQIQNLEQSENIKVQTENHLSDAETVAKSFAQCLVSLSIISPKQIPKLRE